MFRQGLVVVGWFVQSVPKASHAAQAIIPQSVDLHRLAHTWRHHQVVHLGVHPRELHPRLARVEQAVGRIHVDVVARAAPVPLDDLLEHRIKFTQQRVVAGGCVVGPDGFKIPERGVHRVVFGPPVRFWETVGQHPPIYKMA